MYSQIYTQVFHKTENCH